MLNSLSRSTGVDCASYADTRLDFVAPTGVRLFVLGAIADRAGRPVARGDRHRAGERRVTRWLRSRG